MSCHSMSCHSMSCHSMSCHTPKYGTLAIQKPMCRNICQHTNPHHRRPVHVFQSRPTEWTCWPTHSAVNLLPSSRVSFPAPSAHAPSTAQSPSAQSPSTAQSPSAHVPSTAQSPSAHCAVDCAADFFCACAVDCMADFFCACACAAGARLSGRWSVSLVSIMICDSRLISASACSPLRLGGTAAVAAAAAAAAAEEN